MTMTESEKANHSTPIEAAPLAVDSSEENDGETPMLAVWLSLAAIVVAGIYGLYLGTAAKTQKKSDGPASSALVVPGQVQMARLASFDAASCGRRS